MPSLLTDVSMNPQLRIGVGAYLILPDGFLDREPHQVNRAEVAAMIKFRRFSETSSTKLEIQTVLWALDELQLEKKGEKLSGMQIYTDSQCVFGLLGRRAGLESRSYITSRSSQPLRHAGLYREFYSAYDNIGFTLVKVAGHSKSSTHDAVHRVFSYVDQEVRVALSKWLAE